MENSTELDISSKNGTIGPNTGRGEEKLDSVPNTERTITLTLSEANEILDMLSDVSIRVTPIVKRIQRFFNAKFAQVGR